MMEYNNDEDYDPTSFDFGKTLAMQEGGPIKRQGPAILGFKTPLETDATFTPPFVPPEIKKDAWVLKCALSAADFNRRLVHNRPTSFLDLHTNIEQVSQTTQPLNVGIQSAPGEYSVRCVQDGVTLDTKDTNWKHVSTPQSLFPVALMPDQFQHSFAL
jgi:hypothetical protein